MPRPPNPQLTALIAAKGARLAFVLGSGFRHATEAMTVEREIPYAKLPGFPRTEVAGHAGRLLLGRIGGSPVVVLSGRAHFYEGHDLDRVTFPVRVLAALGVKDVLLTSAVGGINRRLREGDFVCIGDHLNFMGFNPLRGGPMADGKRFLDLSRAYDDRLNRLLGRAARSSRTKLRRGTYLAVSGPSYETPAEIRAFARLGADVVGMSIVPEVIVARHCGLNVAALACVTNLAAGRAPKSLAHEDVLEIGRRVGAKAAKLLETFARIHGQE